MVTIAEKLDNQYVTREQLTHVGGRYNPDQDFWEFLDGSVGIRDYDLKRGNYLNYIELRFVALK